MRKEIQGPEGLGVVEIAREMQQVVSEEVVRVLRQLVLCEAMCPLVESVGGNKEKEDAANQLEQAVQTLEDQGHVEGLVEQVSTRCGRFAFVIAHIGRG